MSCVINSCVFPTESELQPILKLALSYPSKRIISIGCGHGYLESLLEKYGVDIVGVDIVGVDLEKSILVQHALMKRGELYLDDDYLAGDKEIILMFCFGKRCPLRKYLKLYDEVSYVIIIGDTEEMNSVTSPNCLALIDDENFDLISQTTMTSTIGPAGVYIYERLERL